MSCWEPSSGQGGEGGSVTLDVSRFRSLRISAMIWLRPFFIYPIATQRGLGSSYCCGFKRRKVCQGVSGVDVLSPFR